MEVDLGVTGWGARPVAQLYLDLAYHSAAPWNESHYSNARVDELIEQARSETDNAVRTAAYKEIQQILLDEGRWSCPISSRSLWCFRECVGRVAASLLRSHEFQYGAFGVRLNYRGRRGRRGFVGARR